MKKAIRSYTLRARAERLAETRARIVQAVMELHQEVGPRHTTVVAIARRAGVERLTVYRHFNDETEMFAACSQLYLELNPPPQAVAWENETDPIQRTQRGLGEIYSFFSRTAPMFVKVYRDVDEFASLKEIMAGFDGYLRGLADDLANAWPKDRGGARRAVILRHATRFATWQSFEAEGLGDGPKASLILEWLTPVSVWVGGIKEGS